MDLDFYDILPKIPLGKSIKLGLKFGILIFAITTLARTIFSILEKRFGLSPVSGITLDETSEGFILFWTAAISLGPVIEEFLFRLLPIVGILAIIDLLAQDLNKKYTFYALYSVIVLSSVLFGLAHGSWHHIFIQGLSGIFLSIVFLKGGFTASVTAHSSHNFLCLVIFYL